MIALVYSRGAAPFSSPRYTTREYHRRRFSHASLIKVASQPLRATGSRGQLSRTGSTCKAEGFRPFPPGQLRDRPTRGGCSSHLHTGDTLQSYSVLYDRSTFGAWRLLHVPRHRVLDDYVCDSSVSGRVTSDHPNNMADTLFLASV